MKTIYIATHPLFNEWTKIGVTSDIGVRKRSYNGSLPINEFTLEPVVNFSDSFAEIFEEICINTLKSKFEQSKREWFKCPSELVKSEIYEISVAINKNTPEMPTDPILIAEELVKIARKIKQTKVVSAHLPDVELFISSLDLIYTNYLKGSSYVCKVFIDAKTKKKYIAIHMKKFMEGFAEIKKIHFPMKPFNKAFEEQTYFISKAKPKRLNGVTVRCTLLSLEHKDNPPEELVAFANSLNY